MSIQSCVVILHILEQIPRLASYDPAILLVKYQWSLFLDVNSGPPMPDRRSIAGAATYSKQSPLP